MTRKERIFTLLLPTLIIGMAIFIKDNRQLTNLLEKTNLKLAQKEMELSAAIWSNNQHYQYTNNRITDFDIITAKRERKPFTSILEDSAKIFYKFSSSDCIDCVKAEIKILKDEAQHIIILAETSDSRWLNVFIKANQINNASIFQIETTLLTDDELPFYFVANNDLHLKDIFFPVRELPNLSTNYYQTMRNKHLN